MSENFLAAPKPIPNDFCDLVLTCPTPAGRSGTRSAKSLPGRGPPCLVGNPVVVIWRVENLGMYKMRCVLLW